MEKGAYCAGCSGVRGKQKPQNKLETQLKVTRDAKDAKSSSSEIKHVEAKVILLGDSGVGKSSLARRYAHDSFSESHDVTIGSAYMQQTVTLEDQTEVKLHIWDTGGSERFRTMVSLYYRDTQAAIICFDVAEEQTFRSTQYWVDEMKKNNNTDEFAMVLTGNKCDISPKDRRVSHAQAAEYAKGHGMEYLETSAKTGQGVQDLFR